MGKIFEETMRRLIWNTYMNILHGYKALSLRQVARELLHGVMASASMWASFSATVTTASVTILGILNLVILVTEASAGKDAWEDVRHKVEAMVDQKIQDHHLETLNSNLRGLVENMVAIRGIYRQFNNALPENREKEGELLRSHHNAFLMYMRSCMPHFQVKEHAVVSLPSFAMAANIQIVMLGDALKSGLLWGYTPDYLNTIRSELNYLTGLGTVVNPTLREGAALTGNGTTHTGTGIGLSGTGIGLTGGNGMRLIGNGTAPTGNGTTIASRGLSHRMQMQLLFDTIHRGEAEGWSAELLKTWKQAYSALSVQRRDVSHSLGHADVRPVDLDQ